MSVEDSDPEEGEIVDDYDIISSDEENVRQRIQELEDKNYELEQIAQISCTTTYSNDYNNIHSKSFRSSANYDKYDYDLKRSRKNYCYNVPSIVSSISSSEEYSPIPGRRRKRPHNKSHYHKSWREHRRREKRHREDNYHSNYSSYNNSPPRNYETECERRLKHLREKINEELLTIAQDDFVNNNNNDGAFKCDELRLAVARNVRSTTKGNRTAETESREEALKDRLGKKNTFKPICISTSTHNKQNDEESSKIITSEDSMSMDEQELRLIALKSAVINKHMARKKRDAESAYTPTDFNDYLNNDDVYSADENNVVLDMTDLTVGMDISPALSPISSSDVEIMENTVNTRPVDMDIAMSDSDVAEVISSPIQFNNNNNNNSNDIYHHHEENTTDMNYVEMQHGMIEETMPTLSLTQPPPPFVPMLTTAPSANDIEPIIINDAMTDNDDLTDDEEEEERALRALLLAKIQYKEKMEKNKLIEENNKKMMENQTPTECILKQAVARLRMKSHSPIVGNVVSGQNVISETTENIPNTLRNPLKIRSVSTINNDYVKIQQSMINNEGNCTINSIAVEKTCDNNYNANALRDISCNDNIQNINNVVFTTTTAATTTTSLAFTSICDNNDTITVEPAQIMLKENTTTITTTRNIPNSVEGLQHKNANNNNNDQDEQQSISVLNGTANEETESQNNKNCQIKSSELKRKSLANLKALRAKRARTRRAKTQPCRVICTRSVTNAKARIQVVENIATTTTETKIAEITIPTTAAETTIEAIPTSITTAPYTKPNYSMNKSPLQLNNINKSSSSRLITTIPKVHVPNLIITLPAVSSDDSDDDCINGNNYNEDYVNYDNASPISLPMDSPAGAPSSRCASPLIFANKEDSSNTSNHNNNNDGLVKKTIVNDCFQQRLDEFLKDVRTKNLPINTKTTPTTTTSTKSPNTKKTIGNIRKAITTITTPKSNTINTNGELMTKTSLKVWNIYKFLFWGVVAFEFDRNRF